MKNVFPCGSRDVVLESVERLLSVCISVKTHIKTQSYRPEHLTSRKEIKSRTQTNDEGMKIENCNESRKPGEKENIKGKKYFLVFVN
jgi:spore cortex formation protein SpoVR/YcgB (stage V sporulation)